MPHQYPARHAVVEAERSGRPPPRRQPATRHPDFDDTCAREGRGHRQRPLIRRPLQHPPPARGRPVRVEAPLPPDGVGAFPFGKVAGCPLSGGHGAVSGARFRNPRA
ncbi:hypothetical protein SGPA1_12429 [Streptomyces misionensis JCM 4497]